MVVALARADQRRRAGCASQFTHCIDIGPTILEVGRHPEPDVVDGIEQKPMHGDELRRLASTTRTRRSATPQQYFEIVGNRAMYKDGWWLACRLDRDPLGRSTPETLAHVRARGLGPGRRTRRSSTTCPTTSRQANDLAAEHPEKVAGAQGALLGRRPRSYNVLPLLGGALVLLRHPAADPGRVTTFDVPRRRPEHRRPG